MHRDAVEDIQPSREFNYLRTKRANAGTARSERGRQHGYRNAQVTVLAPTGTIAFLMDCDTTGVEPDIALVKYKLLAGGGMLKIVNRGVPDALRRLGYSETEIDTIIAHIEKFDTIEDVEDNGADRRQRPEAGTSAGVRLRLQAHRGKRSISYMAHLKMMAAAQPFISGAISKTVNMPQRMHRRGHPRHLRAGLEDGPEMRGHLSRRLQAFAAAQHQEDQRRRRQRPRPSSWIPLEIAHQGTSKPKWRSCAPRPASPLRRRLPDTRTAVTHKFDIAGHEGYLTVGLFDDGQPGELFITMAKEGSTIGGLMDSIGTLTSMALQYGVPLEALVKKFAHQRFEPSGFTKNPGIRNASSITDYVFRWLALPVHPRLSRGQFAERRATRTATQRGRGTGETNCQQTRR